MTQVNAPAPVTRVLRTVKTMGQGAQAPLLLELDLTAGCCPRPPPTSPAGCRRGGRRPCPASSAP